MDELSALPPEGARPWSGSRRSSRIPSRYSTLSPAMTVTSTVRATSPLAHGSVGMSPNTDVKHLLFLPESTSSTNPMILAPKPRRHLIESSASQHWLNTPPISPIYSSFDPSSRPISPHRQEQLQGGVVFPSSSSSSNGVTMGSVPANSVRRRISTHRRSFSNVALQLDVNSANTYAKGGTSVPPSPSTHSIRVRRPSSGYMRSNTSVRNLAPSQSSSHNLGHAMQELEVQEAAMGRRWIRWMHKGGMKQWVIPAIILSSILFKWAVGLGSYSGHATPPMYGDYEAQRHWMEITTHLPFGQWYSYDLQYWGLDYPPLTAYVSWMCGLVANLINPSWVALDTSRGIETPSSKVFMRLTVLALDTFIYVPALLLFGATWQGTRSRRTQELAILTLILQPALILIDFGHFQYNAVMLGFTLLSMNFFAMGWDLWGAFCFVMSLGFKQMALYYAPAIGSYLVAKCLYLGPTEGTRLFVRLALVTSASFILLFLPWLPPFAPISGPNSIFQAIFRIFPFARGLFEDKVANFWCATNVVFKWKRWTTQRVLMRLSTLFTAVGFLPAVVGMIKCGMTMAASREVPVEGTEAKEKEEKTVQQETEAEKKEPEPTPFLALLPYALLTSSLSFFLFSFQVHEKTILLPLMPISLLLSGAPIDSVVYSWGALLNNVAVFSMWPLLKKDGLGVQYMALLVFWNRIVGNNPFKKPKSFVQLLSAVVYSAALVLHLMELVVSPPARYPDIYPVLNVLISTPVFLFAWLWSIKCGVEVGWAVSGLKVLSRSGGKQNQTDTKSTESENGAQQ